MRGGADLRGELLLVIVGHVTDPQIVDFFVFVYCFCLYNKTQGTRTMNINEVWVN